MSRGPFADTIDFAAQVTFASNVPSSYITAPAAGRKAQAASRRTRDSEDRGASDETDGCGSSAPRSVNVPLIQPRYERKTRLNRTMSVTESTGEGGSDTGRSPSTILSTRSREALSVRQGPVRHEETITYHTYALYKHGSKQVHSQSVGYSSDGDLVLHRRDISEASDGQHSNFRRCGVQVDGAVCLNPRAKPKDPVVDGDVSSDPKFLRRLRKLQKYPGVRCPKNRKIRNRLINDHFAGPGARKLYESAHEDSDPDGLKEPAEPTFHELPKTLQWLIDTDEGRQQHELARYGMDVDRFAAAGGGAKPRPLPHTTKSIDSAGFRFGQLPARLKNELQHALSTDYMPGFMDALEVRIEKLITDDADPSVEAMPASLDVECRDGYGRLITHAVASYYKLNSTSETREDGHRVTVVALPKKRVPLPDQRLMSHLRGETSPTTATSSEGFSQQLQRGGKSRAAARVDSSESGGDAEEDAQLRVMRRKRFRTRTVGGRWTWGAAGVGADSEHGAAL